MKRRKARLAFPAYGEFLFDCTTGKNEGKAIHHRAEIGKKHYGKPAFLYKVPVRSPAGFENLSPKPVQIFAKILYD